MAVAKPQLRGHGFRLWTMGGVFSIAAAFATALILKYNVLEKRKIHYREFYEQWDDEKEFQAMRKAGIFKGFEPS